MNEHKHQWDKQPLTSLVDRATCYCGAVRFFPRSGATAAVEQARIQNEKHEKEGPQSKGGMKTMDIKPKTEADNIVVMKKEDHNAMHAGLPPVPPRPDTVGMNNIQARIALGKYYEENAQAILADHRYLVERLGLRKGNPAARKRWGFSAGGWSSFRRRHGLPIAKYKTKNPEPAAEPKSEFEKPAAVDKGNPAGADVSVEHGDKMPTSILKLPNYVPGLPAFPKFNPWWRKDVQIEWLKTYRELVRGKA